ncbi:MAG TPA: TRAM domain-containing protein [Methylomirabilota bacterium]|nr:TRAM domain-containing protein [Methylomirabilota bacterium]
MERSPEECSTVSPPAPPFRVGDRCTVTIGDIAFGGAGVARQNDFVIFVPFVLVGEEVEVEIVEVKRNFARARLRSVLRPSPARVLPECRYFGECGGCQYQHMAYEQQLVVKRKQVEDLIERVGGFARSVVTAVVPCPQPYGYRNRIMIRSQWNKPEQRLNIGFIRHDCGLVVDLEECRIAEPSLNEQIRHVRAHPPPKGGIKVVLRVAPEGWEVPRDSFFQNNFSLLPALVETLRARVREGGARHLVDAYCGVGFFAIELAGAVESFVGVEIDAQAIKAARRNQTSRGAANGEFIQGATEEWLPRLLERFAAERTVVLLDPPRVGVRPSALALLRQVRPAQVLYVSCHPATLARDLNVLCAGGVFELRSVTPLDMFPQTQHVECVADLRAGSGATGAA